MYRIALTVFYFLVFTLVSFKISACYLGEVKFNNDFPGASSDKMLYSCEINKKGNKIKFTLQPENTPINDSPWYAFQLSSKQSKSVKVVIAVKDGTNRYPPKISHDGIKWQPIKYNNDGDLMSFRVKLGPKPLWIAGQEIITNEAYITWGDKLAQNASIEHKVIGHSVDKQPIYVIESRQVFNAKPWLVVLGRQHPPEITGALALFPFVSTLLSDSELANVFRSRFNIAIVPNLNPDGVTAGYWRHNKNGVDLNRDWNKFKQPEVTAVDRYLSTLVEAGGVMSMAVDFHSTKKDIFYTMPSDYGVEQPYLVNNWLNKLDAKRKDLEVIQKPGNNPDLGVFKQYFADKFKVHAITYEMGDNSDRTFIREVAIDAANSLMQTMLTDNNKLR